MLHWLAGAKQPDGADHDTSAVMDAPETPAPVFAVRAFKHAIFGTPQQALPNPRRHSANERERHRPAATAKATRPQITRPKSAGDAATLAIPEPMPSPTKGILMTPGTAAARRKTVTFGDHVVDNAKDKVKDTSKTGLPNDCPGKFPSPWVQPLEEWESAGTPSDRKRGRSKLTEDLHKAREESAKRKAGEAVIRDVEEDKLAGPGEPDSESGKYWKKEYDVYRANTTREVKKLVAKQKAAKSFAREKDLQCTELSDQLRQERKKAERLERRTAELEAQLKALQAQPTNDRTSSLTRDNSSPVRRSVLVGEGAITAARPAHTRSRSTDQPSVVTLDSDLPAKPSEPARRRSRTRKPSIDLQADNAAARSRTRHQPGNLPSDLWARTSTSPSPATPAKSDPSASGVSRNGRAVTSGTNLTPLKSLSINSRERARSSYQDTAQHSPAAERPPASALPSSRENTSPTLPADEPKDENRCDSLDLAAEPAKKPKSSAERLAGDNSPLLPSSPFEPNARPHPASVNPTEKPLPARPASTVRAESKENVSPSRGVGKEAAVDSLQVPRAGAPVRTRDGREVSEDRMAAARARLAARGRKIS